MLVIKSDTTGLISDYNGRASTMLKVFSSSVNTTHSHPNRNSRLFLSVSMLCTSVQVEVLQLSRTRVQRDKLHVWQYIFFFRILTRVGPKRLKTWKLQIYIIYHGKVSHLDRNIKFAYWNAPLVELLKWQTSTILRTQYRNKFTPNTGFWSLAPGENYHHPFILPFLKFCIEI